jgi:hypothetical protein
MAVSERRGLSLSPQAARTLDELAEVEGVSAAAVVERALETRFGLLELAERVPRDDRGRLVRMCVLPESAIAPPGAEVFRIYFPLPDAGRDALSAAPLVSEPDPEPEGSEQ